IVIYTLSLHDALPICNVSVRLRADERDFIKQPATAQIAINAPQTADFWYGNSPNRVSGTLKASGIVQWNGAIADGWFNVYGSNLDRKSTRLNSSHVAS